MRAREESQVLTLFMS